MTGNVGTWGWPMESRCGVLEEENPGLSESEDSVMAMLPNWPLV